MGQKVILQKISNDFYQVVQCKTGYYPKLIAQIKIKHLMIDNLEIKKYEVQEFSHILKKINVE